jgi:hypothetical protein
MSEREHIDPAAAMLARALDATDPGRIAAEQHAKTCSTCRGLLGEGAAVIAAIDSLPRPAPAADVLARVRASVHSESRRASRLGWAIGAAAIVGWFALAARAASGANTPQLATSVGVMALSVVAAALSARGSGSAARRSLGILVAGLAALVVLRGDTAGDGWGLSIGVKCIAFELAGAGLTLGSAVTLARRGLIGGLRGREFATISAAGALAVDAALHLCCAADATLAHLTAFHVAGVLAAALLGAVAGPRLAHGASVV